LEIKPELKSCELTWLASATVAEQTEIIDDFRTRTKK